MFSSTLKKIIATKLAYFLTSPELKKKTTKSLHIRYNFIFYFILFNLPFILTVFDQETLLTKISNKFTKEFGKSNDEILIFYPLLSAIAVGIVFDICNVLITIIRVFINKLTERLFGISLDQRSALRNEFSKTLNNFRNKHNKEKQDLKKEYDERLKREVAQLAIKQQDRNTSRTVKLTPSPQRTPE